MFFLMYESCVAAVAETSSCLPGHELLFDSLAIYHSLLALAGVCHVDD